MSSLYLDRFTRVVPPRAGGTPAAGQQPAGFCRAVACNNATTSFQLDNDIFQIGPAAGQAGTPGGYGRALVKFHAEGNDLYINFDTASTVVANSAAVSGNTQCERIPAGQEREYELDPTIDKWCSARTINGQALTATLRYRTTSFPSQGQTGSG